MMMQRIPTPWGMSDTVEEIAPGVIFVTTPSHGGYRLDADSNARVPLAWREASFNRQGLQGWYEEDCDAAIVVMSFPDLFGADAVERARAAFAHWIEPKLKKTA